MARTGVSINFTYAFRQLDAERKQKVLSDPWQFDEWLREVQDWDARQFRHMLLYLLFPDTFERIFGQQDRRRVLAALGDIDTRAVNAMDPVAIDRALAEIRKKLETQYATDKLDFYLPPLLDQWRQSTLAAAVDAMQAEHVRMALADIDRDGVPASAQSTGYDLVVAGRRYPPKLVFSIAAKHATGQELDRTAFSGGVESPCFRVLERLGFEISQKDLIAPLLSKFLEQARDGTNLRAKGYLEEYRGLKVRVSFGQGNFARIPWIAFLTDGQTVSNGVYPVFLLFSQQNTLLLCYGISETNPPASSWGAMPSGTMTVAEWHRSKFGRSPDRYGESFVKGAYDLSVPLPMDKVRADLDAVIDIYENILGISSDLDPQPEPETIRAEVGEACTAFSNALRAANIDFGARHEQLVSSFVSALVTKPLVILTGLSGSGKTQIAVRFGEWLGEDKLYVAAVRPDWTGSEALFGYEDGLKALDEGRAAWAVPGPLEFMLRAAHDVTNPYLLLLDEMNLAHVERYFADVLSGMESGQPCLPNLVKGSDGFWRVRTQGPDRIPFPRNLWIVGTVNVDETTYMLSPKVLDRASTFEFRVNSDEIAGIRRKPVKCEVGDLSLIRGLLSIARNDLWHEENPYSFQLSLQARLQQLHRVLSRYGLEFGHRVLYESLRFAAIASRASLETEEKVLDRVVLQKILPRLHGSRRRLELPTLALMRFCLALPEVVEEGELLQTLDLERAEPITAKLPQSFEKLSRMLRNLRANQFAGFAE